MKFKDEDIRNSFSKYESGKAYKEQLGRKGMFRQNKINERFFRGDQWHGAKCGNLPLIVQNVIKRIGDYKISNITSNPISITFSADGIPNTIGIKDAAKEMMQAAQVGAEVQKGETPTNEEISFVCDAISEYFKITCERLKFDQIKTMAVKKAFISGTTVLYTYWDSEVETGLYCDEAKTSPIKGDIACQLINIESFYPEDPTCENLQKQKSIIIAERESVKALKEEAQKNGIPTSVIEEIKSDSGEQVYMAGDMSEVEEDGANRATVLTKFFKTKNKDGNFTVHCVKFTSGAIIRDVYDTGLSNYPFSVYKWENIEGCFFGDSETTYLVPNQIAINRLLSACVWNAILIGMPITVVNNSVVDINKTPITNEPGQIISFSDGDLRNAIGYIAPPSTSGEFFGAAGNLIDSTLKQSGANDAALGDIRPENTSAIIAVREAAQQPLYIKLAAFYQFCEDMARIWAEHWFKYYGVRQIKMEDEGGTWYLPIDGDRYKDLVLSAKVDVGPSSLWSELQTISTLDALLDRGIIDVIQYLERVPKGYIPELTKLKEEIKQMRDMEAQAAAMQAGGQMVPPIEEGAPIPQNEGAPSGTPTEEIPMEEIST